jgi:mannose-6-phosphate isomerase-like protein (cupin superfamily)
VAIRLDRYGDLMTDETWSIFKIEEIVRGIDTKEPRFFEFLRTSTLSCAVYHLPAGARDMQAPHHEDEVYFVVSGRATLKVGNEERHVGPGHILYVKATTEHSFFRIEEDLTLIAVFGPYRP